VELSQIRLSSQFDGAGNYVVNYIKKDFFLLNLQSQDFFFVFCLEDTLMLYSQGCCSVAKASSGCVQNLTNTMAKIVLGR